MAIRLMLESLVVVPLNIFRVRMRSSLAGSLNLPVFYSLITTVVSYQTHDTGSIVTTTIAGFFINHN